MATMPHQLDICPFCHSIPYYSERRPGDERDGYTVFGSIICSNDECGARVSATSQPFANNNYNDSDVAVTGMQANLAKRWNRRDDKGDAA